MTSPNAVSSMIQDQPGQLEPKLKQPDQQETCCCSDLKVTSAVRTESCHSSIDTDDNLDVDDCLSYEEEIIDSDDEKEEEFVIHTIEASEGKDDTDYLDEEEEEEEDDDLYEEITVGDDDEWLVDGEEAEEVVELSDEEDQISGNDTYMDDSMANSQGVDEVPGEGSSVATDSDDFGSQSRRDALYNSEEYKKIKEQLEAAMTEGARKAIMEQFDREQSMKEVASRRQKQRQLLEQETAKLKASSLDVNMDDQATKSGSEQTIDARAALVQKVQLVSEVITKKGHSNDLGPSPVDAENKKQALAELRRQTAREELRKSNTLLKVTQAPPSNSNPPCLNSPRSVSQPQEIDSSINSPSSGKHPSLSFSKLPGKPVPIQLDFGTPDGSEYASEREKDRSLLFNCEGSNAGMTSERNCDPVSVTSGSMPLNGSGHRTGSPHCPIRSVVQDIDKDSEYKKGVADIDSMKQNPSTTIDEPSVVHSGNGEKSAHASVTHARTMSPVCGSPCSPATRRNIARRLINAFECPTMEHSPSQNLVERSSRKPLESPVSWQNPITSEEQPLSNRPKQPVSIGKTCNDVPSMFRAAQEARCQHESKESELEKSALVLSSEESDGEYYSLEQLQTGNIKNIDIRHREQYLSPDAFWQHFKMTKEQFSELPKWKRDKAKRSLKLF